MPNFFVPNETRNFFLENATSAKERLEITTLTEAELKPISNNLVTELYKSVIEKAHIDFEDIPASKGDITKYKGYIDMVKCLDIISRIATKNNTKIIEVEIVQKSIANIVALRDQFTKGYSIGNKFLILQYNTLVAACVESTSILIASYVDYVKRVDSVDFEIINTHSNQGGLCIANLKRFNELVASGDYTKMCNAVLSGATKSIITESAVVITFAVLTTLVAGVILLKNIVFKLFYARMKISEYLNMQAMFLEMNKNNIEASGSNIPPAKKKEIIKKQQELSNKLSKLSDKIRVDVVMSDSTSIKEVKKSNSTYTLDVIKNTNNIDNIELL